MEGVAERILAMLMNEAADAVFWQVASPADIDTAMQKGVNYPKGLWRGLTAGHPKLINIMDSLRQRYGEERYKVSPCFATWRVKDALFSADCPFAEHQTNADAGQTMGRHLVCRCNWVPTRWSMRTSPLA